MFGNVYNYFPPTCHNDECAIVGVLDHLLYLCSMEPINVNVSLTINGQTSALTAIPNETYEFVNGVIHKISGVPFYGPTK